MRQDPVRFFSSFPKPVYRPPIFAQSIYMLLMSLVLSGVNRNDNTTLLLHVMAELCVQ